jgi:hypothetical protein
MNDEKHASSPAGQPASQAQPLSQTTQSSAAVGAGGAHHAKYEFFKVIQGYLDEAARVVEISDYVRTILSQLPEGTDAPIIDRRTRSSSTSP